MGAGAEEGLPGSIGADRVLAKNSSRVGGVTKDGDGEGKTSLHLIKSGDAPAPGHGLQHVAVIQSGKIIDRAQGEAVADVTGRAFFRGQIAVVLRNGRLKHG